jgi:hypothetical protein
MAMSRGQFENPGRGTSAVGSRYPRTSVGQQTKRTQCVCNELKCVLYWTVDCNCAIAIAL